MKWSCAAIRWRPEHLARSSWHALLMHSFLMPSPLLRCSSPHALPQVRSMDAEACLLFGLTREAVKSKSVLTMLKPQGEPAGSSRRLGGQQRGGLGKANLGWVRHGGCNYSSNACPPPAADYRLAHNARCEDFLGGWHCRWHGPGVCQRSSRVAMHHSSCRARTRALPHCLTQQSP